MHTATVLSPTFLLRLKYEPPVTVLYSPSNHAPLLLRLAAATSPEGSSGGDLWHLHSWSPVLLPAAYHTRDALVAPAMSLRLCVRPAISRLPGAPTRRCRVRLQRPIRNYNSIKFPKIHILSWGCWASQTVAARGCDYRTSKSAEVSYIYYAFSIAILDSKIAPARIVKCLQLIACPSQALRMPAAYRCSVS